MPSPCSRPGSTGTAPASASRSFRSIDGPGGHPSNSKAGRMMASDPGIVTDPRAPESQAGGTQAAPRPLLWGVLLPAWVSGFLLWLCYFPAAWGWLAWLALVPLLILVRSPARARRIYLSAWLGGLAFYLPAL